MTDFNFAAAATECSSSSTISGIFDQRHAATATDPHGNSKDVPS
jgi:hypothetical protein